MTERAAPGAPGVATSDHAGAASCLVGLRDALDRVSFPYALASADDARGHASLLRDQLGDYVLPRLASLDAPLLGVVGGSTGAGKSTLVSSLVRTPVATASAIRPTTRRPLLLHAPGDAPWFDSDRVLGSLARVRVADDAPPTPPRHVTARELELRSCRALPEGLALLDAPDVDSVVTENRTLAATLLAGADLWVFVTTAARYADAVPWEHLRAAAARNVVTAVVLDRVPDGAAGPVESDLRERLAAAGLGDAPVFTIAETDLDSLGLLPEHHVAPLRSWLSTLAADQAARREVARRTLAGAVGAALAQTQVLAVEIDAQEQARLDLAATATAAHEGARERIEAATGDGAMLRGEVLARWQELVGTGEVLRGMESWISWARDRLTAALRGRPAPATGVEQAIESHLAGLLVAESQRAALETERAWRRAATAPEALATALAALPAPEDRGRGAASLVRAWQGRVLELVRAEGGDKRLTARLLSIGVNVVGVALMILVFAHTGGLTGGEVGIAGGTALLAQRLLEAVFGDQAVRGLAERARQDLLARATELLATQEALFTTALPEARPAGEELRTACQRARSELAALLAPTPGGTP